MSSKKNINDILISLNPKVIRFTGEKFPTELWSKNPLKKNNKLSA
tara:strand:+ start:409 stop:543 length:135 start_codon:yes stop_codon:yes gene_type:complete